MDSEKQCHWKSSDNVISNVDPVESEPDKQIKDNTIQREFSSIIHAIASLGETHAAAHEIMNKKLDSLVTKQEIMNDKMNVLAIAVGIDINAQKGTEVSDK